ncbi:MAG: beta-lactamase [Acidobacteriaceae bacterium]|nr:beta-lactamase [Acidobacteriaceae bacterium]
MNRREWLRNGALIGGGLASSIASALNKPNAVPLMLLKRSDPESAESEKIDNIFVAAGLTAGNIPGAAVLVANNGGVLFQRGYGFADLRSQRKIDARTNFRLASCTKQFTAMAIMLLVHDGTLHYGERLTDIFPDFPEYGRAITIRNLLNHTSGLQDYEDLMSPDPAVPVEQIQIQDAGVLDLLKRQTSTKFTPGSQWAYSNSGYVLLGLIVQKVSGKTFPDFLHDRIFQPLNMSSTVAYVRGKNDIPNRAFGHSLEGKSSMQTDQSPTSATLGDGGVYSSLEDLAKWDQALRRNALLSQREMQPALTPVKVSSGQVSGPDGSPAAYGFGWFLNPYRSHQRMWHYGETMGFRTTIQHFVADNLTIIILCNRADLNPSALALQVADLFLGAPPNCESYDDASENTWLESNHLLCAVCCELVRASRTQRTARLGRKTAGLMAETRIVNPGD